MRQACLEVEVDALLLVPERPLDKLEPARALRLERVAEVPEEGFDATVYVVHGVLVRLGVDLEGFGGETDPSQLWPGV